MGEQFRRDQGLEFRVLRFPHLLDRNAKDFPLDYAVLYDLFAHGLYDVPFEIKCPKDKEFHMMCAADAVSAVVLSSLLTAI